jgi:hypothetical protein
MESGRVKVHQQKRKYAFEIKGAKVFATANEISKLSKPLQSRFRKLFLPRYSEQQFIDVSVKVLSKIGENMARYIGSTVYKSQGDIRDVISIGKLVRRNDGPDEIEQILSTIIKYGNERILNRTVVLYSLLAVILPCAIGPIGLNRGKGSAYIPNFVTII